MCGQAIQENPEKSETCPTYMNYAKMSRKIPENYMITSMTTIITTTKHRTTT